MKRVVTLAAAALLPLMAATAHAGKCGNYLPKIPDNCSGLDTSVSLEGNPFVYTNPDASCDLGFSLPGLPNFGLSMGSIGSCEILKKVTGEFVSKINREMRDAMDQAVKESTNGMGTEVTIDPSRLVTDPNNPQNAVH